LIHCFSYVLYVLIIVTAIQTNKRRQSVGRPRGPLCTVTIPPRIASRFITSYSRFYTTTPGLETPDGTNQSWPKTSSDYHHRNLDAILLVCLALRCPSTNARPRDSRFASAFLISSCRVPRWRGGGSIPRSTASRRTGSKRAWPCPGDCPPCRRSSRRP